MTNHTPGPWRLSDRVEDHGLHWEQEILAPDCVAYATSTGVHGPLRKEEMHANALLMAAAPDLLDAAAASIEAINQGEPEIALLYLRKAIAKAEGLSWNKHWTLDSAEPEED